MSSKKRELVVFFVVSLLVLACSLTRQASPTLMPPTVSVFAQPPSPPPNSDWQFVANGIETRILPVDPPFTDTHFGMLVVRVDPTQTLLRVHYTPRQWYNLTEWWELLPEAAVIVNANFFNAAGEAVGLVVADGVFHGASLEGFGGMLEITYHNGVRVRSLVTEPYREEQFLQAIQGFPMLLEQGGEPARTGEGFDDPARRTMIGQDREGRLLIFVTPLLGRLSLREAQKWLYHADLDLEIAFGLDGGKSSGMVLMTPNQPTIYPSVERVPVVLAVYPR